MKFLGRRIIPHAIVRPRKSDGDYRESNRSDQQQKKDKKLRQFFKVDIAISKSST